MNIKELKQVQLFRQHLTNKADPLIVAHDLCGIQCQFMVNAVHSFKIRCEDDLQMECWQNELVKNWSVRNTVHVFCKEDLPLFRYNDGKDNYLDSNWEDEYCQGRLWISGERKRFFVDYITKCVNQGIELREELKEKCRALGMTRGEELFIFDGWGGLLAPMCKRGYITYKVQEKKAFQTCPPYRPMDKIDARKEQMRRYLEHIAPATINDVAYFFKYSKREVYELFKLLPIKSFVIGSKELFYIGEIENNYPDIPKCIFLAGFDQLMMGYQKAESIYLKQEFLRNIFNLAGIVMPGVLVNGEVIGKWRKKGKKLEIICFEAIDEQKRKNILDEAEKLWHGDINSIMFTA